MRFTLSGLGHVSLRSPGGTGLLCEWNRREKSKTHGINVRRAGSWHCHRWSREWHWWTAKAECAGIDSVWGPGRVHLYPIWMHKYTDPWNRNWLEESVLGMGCYEWQEESRVTEKKNLTLEFCKPIDQARIFCYIEKPASFQNFYRYEKLYHNFITRHELAACVGLMYKKRIQLFAGLRWKNPTRTQKI